LHHQVFLSVIIPAYNEEHRLPHTLEKVIIFLKDQPYTFEVIVVENGSTDRTLEVAKSFASREPCLKVIHERDRGKGNAVRRGILASHGKYLFMCDADLSMPISEVNRFIPPTLENVDIAIASREAPGAIRYHEPHYRHIGGRLINTLIRILALPGFHDTQCGFKCFRAEVAEDLFNYQTLTRWSFDIELLYIAKMRGYCIVELPIPWYFNPESKLNLLQDAIQMGLDIFTIRKNAKLGIYDSKKV
jgi:glycosyltransferase involved in cell wall biosynthesis